MAPGGGNVWVYHLGNAHEVRNIKHHSADTICWDDKVSSEHDVTMHGWIRGVAVLLDIYMSLVVYFSARCPQSWPLPTDDVA